MTDTVERNFTLERVDWLDARAIELRRLMDVEIYARYADKVVPGVSHEDLVRVLAVDPESIQATLLALEPDGTPIGHAALRLLNGEWEVKRVIVLGDQRRRGIGWALMHALEGVARAGHARRLILETGDRQPEAVTLYERMGYTPIPIYEPYIRALPYSLCFEKLLG